MPVIKPPDDRPPMAQAMVWTSHVTTIAMEFALPGLFGYWVDLRLATKPLFLIVGVVLGFGVGMLHLVQLTKQK